MELIGVAPSAVLTIPKTNYLHVLAHGSRNQRLAYSPRLGGRCLALLPTTSPYYMDDVLSPLLGAARAQLGVSSSWARQWVESEPCRTLSQGLRTGLGITGVQLTQASDS